MLTPSQAKSLQKLKEQCELDIKKIDPNLPAMLAGMSLSKDGASKIAALQEKLFDALLEAANKLPEQFSLDIPSEHLADVDTRATFYICSDNYRHIRGSSIFKSKRDAIKDYNDMMDARILYAAAQIKRARIFLPENDPSRVFIESLSFK